jgi:hypothetical protein
MLISQLTLPSEGTRSRQKLPKTANPEKSSQSLSIMSSLSGHKRCRPEAEEVDVDCRCAVCWEVLLDVVTLPCGHSLDQRCLQKIVATTSGGAGQRACPVCRHALPAELPAVNVQMCTMVQRLYPEQVGRENPNRYGGAE